MGNFRLNNPFMQRCYRREIGFDAQPIEKCGYISGADSFLIYTNYIPAENT